MSASDDICPCCGQTLPPQLNIGIYLNSGDREILELVSNAGRWGINSEKLFEKLYRDRHDGGPTSGMKVMHTRICLLNRRLKHKGWRIKSDYSGNGTGNNASRKRSGKTPTYGNYKLVQIDGSGRTILYGPSGQTGTVKASGKSAVPGSPARGALSR